MLRSLEDRMRRVERRAVSPPKSAGRHPTAFGWEWEAHFLGNHLEHAPSRFHNDLMADLHDLHHRRGSRRNYRGPRGSGKTAHISNAYPLWATLEGVEPFVLLLAETGQQAELYLKAIRTELEENDRIRAAYPQASGVGRVWQHDRIEMRNGACIVARGSKGRVLGLKHRGRRPTLVIGDDLNERGDMYSPTMRQRKLEWFLKDVMKVGTPETNFVVAGTSIHWEAITCSLTGNGAWDTRRYQSVIRWPNRMDLWQQWERVLTNQGDDDRKAKALAFYEANRAAMDDGAEVLWPAAYPLYALMVDRAESGDRSFRSERQDEPGADGSTTWPPEVFDRADLWFDDWPDDLRGCGCYLDPSSGKSETADFQAHVRGGWSKSLNALCVEADLMREPPSEMVSRATRHAKGFGGVVTVETNGDLGFMIQEFARHAAASGVGLQGINNVESKRARILSLDALIGRKRLKIRRTAGGRELVRQLRDDPNADHDDGPDALAGLKDVVNQNLAKGL